MTADTLVIPRTWEVVERRFCRYRESWGYASGIERDLVLQIRGTASIETMQGVSPEYTMAAKR